MNSTYKLCYIIYLQETYLPCGYTISNRSFFIFLEPQERPPKSDPRRRPPGVRRPRYRQAGGGWGRAGVRVQPGGSPCPAGGAGAAPAVPGPVPVRECGQGPGAGLLLGGGGWALQAEAGAGAPQVKQINEYRGKGYVRRQTGKVGDLASE